MRILGISCFFHDAAAALLVDGRLAAAAEEERFSRRKHDPSFPRRAIQFCLRHGGLHGANLDYVVFYEKPFLKFERLVRSCLSEYPLAWSLFRESMTRWLPEKLWVKHLIAGELGVSPQRILFCEHHVSHGASGFFASPFEEAAILTVDAVGEWATTTAGVGRGNEIRLLREIRFPHSLGMLYSAFTAFLGFEVNEGEYKVMGLAPYGQPRYVDKVRRLLEVAGDGSFRLDLDYFAYQHSATSMFTPRFLRLFGEPRNPRRSDVVEPYYADLAASVQVVLEEVLLQMVRALHKETGLTRLCMAGGVALNSVANGRILRETPFTEIFIQPAAGDGGGALGAALWACHSVLGEPRRFVMEHAYWGEAHGEESAEACFKANGVRMRRFADPDVLIDRTVELLTQGKVVGWVQGRFEFGPRALGNRSILADPRRPEMKEVVNRKIKFREAFRPFAPTVLAEAADRFFTLPEGLRQYPARFMLYVVPVRDGAKEKLPATTHVDGSARVQTIHREANPLYYELIDRFGHATGVPVLLNTSFNLKGEPIVNTPEEALRTFMRSDMDALVVNSCMVEKDA